MMKPVTIIGSSNFYRFVDDLDAGLRRAVDMQNCTNMQVFRARMDALNPKVERVIIGVIENFLVDVVEDAYDPVVIEERVKNSLDKFFRVVEEAAKRLKSTKFALVEPMARPAVKWYSEAVEALALEFFKRVDAMNKNNVFAIKGTERDKQIFDSRKVHLTPEAGHDYVLSVLGMAETLFETEMEVVEEETDENAEVEVMLTDGEGARRSLEDESGPIAQPSGSQKNLQDQINEIKVDINERRHNDSMVLARIREEQDHQLNIKKEDRILIMGLTSETRQPAGQAEAKKWLLDIVGEMLNKIVPESADHIQFVNAIKGAGGESQVPVCEAKMKEREWAVKIRREFGKLKKEGKIEGRLFIANSVTLATRVRLEILRAMARKCSSPREDMHVVAFTSRPLLQVKPKDGGQMTTLTFVDAIARMGKKMIESDFGFAYGKAGISFKGQMQQNFVVLHEKGVKAGAGQWGGASRSVAGGKNKRPREQMESESRSAKRNTARGRGGRGGGSGNGAPVKNKKE